jgi:protein-tyrosine-phosphatase
MSSTVSSGRLCEETLRAFDRLCELEQSREAAITDLTPRQRHRRVLLEKRARSEEWLVPDQLAATVLELVATADRISDPALALVWTDHLPVAVLAVIERRGFRRRLADGDIFLAG